MTAHSTPIFSPRDWFWLVGVEQRPWSSAAAIAAGDFASGYVDADQVAADRCTSIESETELRDQRIAIVSGLTMLSRLTEQEYAALRAAEAASPSIGRWFDMLRVNGEINLFGLTAEAARAGLVQAGLLTAERAAVVFAPQLTGS